jgi:8-oxo-dGTP pyrophosphatase MutT (NUDIX family)
MAACILFTMVNVAMALIRQLQNNEESFLLIRSAHQFEQYTNYWYLPGGHVEDGESSEQTVIRECEEELDVSVIPTSFIATTPGDVPDLLIHWWEASIIAGTPIAGDEIAEIRFVTQAEMQQLPMWPATSRFFNTHVFTNSHEPL